MQKNIFVFFSITIFSLMAFSHSGGANSAGCHFDHKNGGYHCHRSNTTVTSEARRVSSEDYEVSYNTKSGKIHRPNCKSAKSCTVNCITLKKSEAISRGGVACGNCGG